VTADPRFRRLRDLFDEALDLPQHERAAFVDAACADDSSLRAELLRLLDREQRQHLISDEATLSALDRTLRRALPQAFVEGQLLGPFRVIESIGDGGMGHVYRALRVDGVVEQQVAIKLVRTDLFNPALRQRFSAERRLLSTLAHPNICGFIDAGELRDGTPYVVMEFIDGVPLLQYCDRQRLTLEQRLRLLRKICGAVEHAHRQLIVHRDIKSANILVTDAGEPKLLDFGIATSLGNDRDATMTADRFLTPSNAAPEQLRGEPVGVGCDVYALGLLAYELFAGVPAYVLTGRSAAEMERLILLVPPLPMSQQARSGAALAATSRGLPSASVLATRLAGDLDAIVAACLRKAGSERYPNVGQLDADLLRVLERKPISVRGGDRAYRMRKFVGRHRLAVGLVATLAFVVVAALTTVGWLAFDLAEQRNVAIRERDRAEHAIRLLQDAVVAADPARVGGETLTMRDVLARAETPLERLFDEQPGLYADLAATIVEVQLSLGNDTVAARLAGRALEASSRVPFDRARLRRLTLLHGRALTNAGDLVGALPVLERVRQFDASEQPDWQVAWGRLLMRHARFVEAADALQRATAVLTLRGPDDDLASEAHWELARALRYNGRHDDALAANARTLQWQREGIGDDHPRTALTRMNRVDLLWAAKRHEEAIPEGRAAVAEIRRIYGADSLMAARAGSMLAVALRGAGQTAEAIALSREVLAVWRRRLGDDHASTIRGTYNLAAVLTETDGGQREARELLVTAVAAAERRFGLAADTTHFMRIGLAETLLDQHRPREALRVLASPAATTGLAGLLPVNRDEYLALLQRAEGESGCTNPAADPRCRVALAIRQNGGSGGADR